MSRAEAVLVLLASCVECDAGACRAGVITQERRDRRRPGQTLTTVRYCSACGDARRLLEELADVGRLEPFTAQTLLELELERPQETTHART
jgi:hypothetical protein